MSFIASSKKISVAMAADSTQDNQLLKRKKRSRKRSEETSRKRERRKAGSKKAKSSSPSRGRRRSRSGGESGHDSDMDLDRDLLPIGGYLKQREDMVRHLFRSISTKKLHAMLPEILKPLPVDELRQLCQEQLMVMSRKRIKRILDGADPQTISSTDEDESSTDEEEAPEPAPDPVRGTREKSEAIVGKEEQKNPDEQHSNEVKAEDAVSSSEKASLGSPRPTEHGAEAKQQRKRRSSAGSCSSYSSSYLSDDSFRSRSQSPAQDKQKKLRRKVKEFEGDMEDGEVLTTESEYETDTGGEEEEEEEEQEVKKVQEEVDDVPEEKKEEMKMENEDDVQEFGITLSVSEDLQKELMEEQNTECTESPSQVSVASEKKSDEDDDDITVTIDVKQFVVEPEELLKRQERFERFKAEPKRVIIASDAPSSSRTVIAGGEERAKTVSGRKILLKRSPSKPVEEAPALKRRSVDVPAESDAPAVEEALSQSSMEILELEMRARAIKAMLKAQEEFEKKSEENKEMEVKEKKEKREEKQQESVVRKVKVVPAQEPPPSKVRSTIQKPAKKVRSTTSIESKLRSIASSDAATLKPSRDEVKPKAHWHTGQSKLRSDKLLEKRSDDELTSSEDENEERSKVAKISCPLRGARFRPVHRSPLRGRCTPRGRGSGRGSHSAPCSSRREDVRDSYRRRKIAEAHENLKRKSSKK